MNKISISATVSLDILQLEFLFVIERTPVLSFRFRKELSEIFFPFGRYRSETINLLILEDPTASSNRSFLGPVEFIGIGRNPVKYRFFLSTIFRLLIRYISTATTKSITPLIVKDRLLVEPWKLRESRILKIRGSKSYRKRSWWKKM